MKSIFILTVLFISAPALSAKIDEQLHNLPVAQRIKALETLDRYRDDIVALRAETRSKSQALLAKIRNPGKGEQYRKELLEEWERLQVTRSKLTSKQFELRLEIREFLTREQITSFEWLHVPAVLKREEIDY